MEYIKDFENWNNKKKSIESNTYMPYFDIGEIWWCSLGINIGAEVDGKGVDYLRPVIILAKYNQFGCYIIPLSSARLANKDNIYVGIVQAKQATANLSQTRSISSKRLIEKIQKIEINQLLSIQKAVIEYNFPLQLFEILPPKNGEQPEGQHSN